MGKSLSFERRPERREIQPIGVEDGMFQRKQHVQVSRGEVTPGKKRRKISGNSVNCGLFLESG